MPAAVVAQGLSKRYRTGERTASYGLLHSAAARLARRRGASANGNAHIWALDDVSFELEAGEVLGVIGRNGAGKSTLLKILSRITDPTRGSAVLRGRVGSLLEIGTGFHPELTGRENVFLNGAILGMRRREIERKFDEIAAFSEIERFLDTPVKRYSSGMAVRLAFAVAAHLDLEIMIVDEVLAVGDAAFQRKCLGKMGDVSSGGRTILFVSHSMPAVTQLCTRALLLSDGRVVVDGGVSNVVAEYMRAIALQGRTARWSDPAEAPGSDRVRLRSARAVPGPAGGSTFGVAEPITLEFEYWALEEGSAVRVGIAVRDGAGTVVFVAGNFEDATASDVRLRRGAWRTTAVIPDNLLVEGPYTVDLVMGVYGRDPELAMESVVSFDVVDDGAENAAGIASGVMNAGVVRPKLAWSTREAEE
jgi:lipopolysaccharide transport system ATP-binding protein